VGKVRLVGCLCFLLFTWEWEGVFLTCFVARRFETTARKGFLRGQGQRGRSRDHRRDGRDDDGREQRGRYWHGGGARRRR
jgi:hypothetical protein